MEKLAEALWKHGIDIPLKEIKKWMQPFTDVEVQDPERIANALEKVWETTGRTWVPLVVLNQAFHMFNEGNQAAEFLEKLVGTETDPLAVVVAWRTERMDPHVIMLRKMEPPKYADSSDDIVGFFLNVYRYEGGIDTEELSERIRNSIENERLAREFFRLVDIDKPLPPEEFVKRVERALDVIAKAKEQGLDIGRIFSVWDEMADEGGERLEKLAGAVKRVAEEAVKERFWENVARELASHGIDVFDGEIPENVLEHLYYLGMISIEGGEVEMTGMEDFIADMAALLKNARPIPMYKLGEVAETMKRMGITLAQNSAEVLYTSSILRDLSRKAAKVFVETDTWEPITNACIKAAREGIETENVREAVEEALTGIYDGRIGGKEEVEQYINKKLFS